MSAALDQLRASPITQQHSVSILSFIATILVRMTASSECQCLCDSSSNTPVLDALLNQTLWILLGKKKRVPDSTEK